MSSSQRERTRGSGKARGAGAKFAIPTEDGERQLQHAAVAAEASALRSVVSLLRQRSAEAYVRKQDAVALIIRDLADEVDATQQEASDKLDAFIAYTLTASAGVKPESSSP